MASGITAAELRRYAIARSLFAPVGLQPAIERLGFVQADPIRAPARAQDLALRHRVAGYRAGDLDRGYPALDVEEDFVINYGFVPRAVYALMHPRTVRPAWSASRRKRAQAVLDFIRERGDVHPRDVDAHFAHGAVVNAWGGSSNATTHLLDAMHYRGWLRVVRREAGIRIYAAREFMRAAAPAASAHARLDALVDMVVREYAPLPAQRLSPLVRRLRYAAPQLARGIDDALWRAKRRLAHARVDGADWYWPADETPREIADALDGEVRLLAPFDPIVWDRVRFERFFGWAYRFEAYTPPSRRKLGYYALPLLHGDAIPGWANLTMTNGALASDIGYVRGTAPRGHAFARALDDELARMHVFLSVRAAE
ncbi:MAG TPA: crosslink repair DNA glycosylase YcaQ family protein [Casimicrobiaceae bacterium]|nr:crosslink repair DNA glycosylase YcaQ family protein [Casimicrobiaceae bacterium]